MLLCGASSRTLKSRGRHSETNQSSRRPRRRPLSCLHGNLTLDTYTTLLSPETKRRRVTPGDQSPRRHGTSGEVIQSRLSASLGSEGDSGASLSSWDSERSSRRGSLSGDSGITDGSSWSSTVTADTQKYLVKKEMCRGQVKLSIRVEDTKKLIIQVKEIGGITVEESCELHIETQLIPDPTGQTIRATARMSADTKVVMEEITYDMQSADDQKRLAVSAWLKDANKTTSEMKGCMSFGIKNLLSKNKKKEMPVDGWYSFLPEHAGQKGHLAVTDQSALAETKESKSASAQILKKLQDVPRLTLTIPRSQSGFGFTIKGTTPVRVGRVKPEGIAEKHGLKAGDAILNINSRDTAAASMETVKKIVRNCTDQLTMVVARTTSRSLRHKSPGCLPVFSTCGPGKSNDIYGNRSTVEHLSVAQPPEGAEMSAAERISQWGASLSQTALADLSNRYASWQPELSVINEEKSPDVRQQLLGQLAAQQKLQVSGQKVVTGKKFVPTAEPIYEEITTPAPPPTQAAPRPRPKSWTSLNPETASSCDPDSYTDTDNNNTTNQHLTHTGRPKSGPPITAQNPPPLQPMSMAKLQHMWTFYANEADSSVGGTTAAYTPRGRCYQPSEDESDYYDTRRSVVSAMSGIPGGNNNNLVVCSDERQVAIHQLVTCEEDFVRLMKRGIQRFSRPLRHHILSQSQHATLFQNVEKLVALTEFHIRNLIESSFSAEDSYTSANNNISVDYVGSIYKPKIGMVCDVYKTYCEGLGRALDLLESLRQTPDFYKFQQRTENLRGFELTMSEFLRHPMSHFQQLVGSLGRVLLTTGQEHRDYRNIKAVMEVIHMSMTAGPPTPITAPQNQSSYSHHGNTSLGGGGRVPQTPSFCHYDNSRWTNASAILESTALPSPPPPPPAHKRLLRPDRELSTSRTSLSSVDTEIMEMQQNLSFPKHIKPFQLATSQRHMIFSGELTCDTAEGGATSLWAVLCTDLLLLTHRHQGEPPGPRLKVVQEPIMMQHIVATEFSLEHDCEFSLIATVTQHQSAPSNSTGVLEFRLRATNLEQKWAWKTLLEQRIKTCKSQTDSAFSSTEEFM